MAQEIVVNTDAAVKGLVDLNNEMRILKDTSKELDKAMDDLNQEYVEGSVDMAEYNKRQNEITSAQVKNTKATTTAITKQKALSDQLKKNTKSLNDSSNAAKGLASQYGGPLGTAIVSVIEGTKQLGIALKGAFIGGANAAKIFKLAVISTGVGAFIVVIASLATWFTKTERGAQALRIIMAQFDVIMGEVTDTMVEFVDESIAAGESLGIMADGTEDVEKGIKGIKDETIGTQEEFSILRNVVEAVAQPFIFLAWISEKIQQAINGTKLAYAAFLALTGRGDEAEALLAGIDEVARKMEEAESIQRGLNDLRVEEREVLVSEQRELTEIARLKGILANTDNEAAERVAAGEAAEKRLRKLTADKIGREKRRLVLMKAEAKLNETNEDTLDAIAQQELKIEKLLTDQENKLKEIKSTTGSISKATKSRAAAEEDVTDELEKQNKLLEKQRKLGLDDDAAYAKVAALEAARITDTEARIAKQKELELDAMNNLLNNADLTEGQRLLIIEQSYDKQKALDDELAAYKTANSDAVAANDKANALKKAKYDKQVAEADMALKMAVGQGAADIMGFLASNQEQGSEEWKAMAASQVLINSGLGIANILATAPVLTWPAAFVSLGVASALSLAKVLSTPIPKSSISTTIPSHGFQVGGYTGYGLPNEVAGTVHKGEYVVPSSVLGTSIGSQLVSGLEGMRTGTNIPQQANIADQVVAGLQRSPIFVRVKDIVDETGSYVTVIDNANY